MEENHRRPSKYNMEERNDWNRIRHQQKQMNAGLLKLERIEMFIRLVEVGEKHRRFNQWR